MAASYIAVRGPKQDPHAVSKNCKISPRKCTPPTVASARASSGRNVSVPACTGSPSANRSLGFRTRCLGLLEHLRCFREGAKSRSQTTPAQSSHSASPSGCPGRRNRWSENVELGAAEVQKPKPVIQRSCVATANAHHMAKASVDFVPRYSS